MNPHRFTVRTKDENGQTGRFTKLVHATNVALAWQIVIRELVLANILPIVTQISLGEER